MSKNASPRDSQAFSKDHTGEHPNDQVFSSYWSEKTMVAKVKDVLPSTPDKKAWIIESQNKSKILEKKGILIKPESLGTIEKEQTKRWLPRGSAEKL